MILLSLMPLVNASENPAINKKDLESAIEDLTIADEDLSSEKMVKMQDYEQSIEALFNEALEKNALEQAVEQLVKLSEEKQKKILNNHDWLKIRHQNGGNLAHFLAKIDDISLFTITIDFYPRLLEEIDNNGDTAIHTAFFYGAQKIVEMLLHKFPNLIGRKGQKGLTPLHMACAKNQIKVLELFLGSLQTIHQSFVSQVDDYGNTIFHAACSQGADKVVQLLVKECTDLIAIKNKSGVTPLHFACANNQIEVVEFLLSRLMTTHPSIVSEVDD